MPQYTVNVLETRVYSAVHTVEADGLLDALAKVRRGEASLTEQRRLVKSEHRPVR